MDFSRVESILQNGHHQRAYPAAVIEVGRADSVLWTRAVGRLTYDADSPAASTGTVFDLASLTKPIITATLVMSAIDEGHLRLTDQIHSWLPQWRGRDREFVQLRSLLTHSSGLTAVLPFFRNYRGRAEYQHAICDLPLEYVPDTRSVYSDLGFMLLGFVLEDVRRRAFAEIGNELATRVTWDPLLFNPPASMRPRIAPTSIDPWRGRLLVGEVDDENCWALGGAGGHAGLFGTSTAVGDFARLVLQAIRGTNQTLATTATMRAFSTKAAVPGSRALGWDTMLPTSSCGTKMSTAAFGHTGFTGTSLWIDPVSDVYVVLLTNRVHPTRDHTAIQQIRPAVHDAVMVALGH